VRKTILLAKLLSRGKKRLKRVIKRLLLPAMSPPPKRVPRKRTEWSIAIYGGNSPFDFTPPQNIENPVLTVENISDVQAVFVADPFMLRVDHTWYMFFEVMNRQTRRGEIGFACSEDATKWTYHQIVLAELFHLSYPYVFEWRGDHYMIPESYQARSIRLYRAVQFPTRWSLVTTLLNGDFLADASIVRYHDKWWMFVETNPQLRYDTLRLYYADELCGPWREHPQSPIIEGNPHIARPAGRVLVHNDRVIRYAQDCFPTYGAQVCVFEITELTTTSYREREAREGPVLRSTGSGWNGSGMHHIDPYLMDDGRWVACVDGWCQFNPTDEKLPVRV
jgi:hypothetical protein